MRVGLDLRTIADPGQRLAAAVEADRLGLWAVLIGGQPGAESIEAAIVAANTSSIQLVIPVDVALEHPLTLAEEISVVDHLSERRVVVLPSGPRDRVTHVSRLLDGHIVDGVSLAPPPAQTSVPVRTEDQFVAVALSGDVVADGEVIDKHRDEGCTHLFVSWSGPLLPLARHLMTRAAGPGFPTVVAELADRIDPKTP